MEEILKDKLLWTKAKFKEKKEIHEKTESIVSDNNGVSRGENVDVIHPEQHKEQELEETEEEEVEAFKSIANKVIGLYFSANWCVPCREFTSLLKQTYDELKERASPFEVVFISFDKKLDDMKEYFTEEHGDWLAVPHKDTLVETLKSKYDIKAIPKLIVIRDDGTIITEKGRKDIQDKGMICFRGWQQKANLSVSKPCDTDPPAITTETNNDKTVSFNENISNYG